MLRLFNENGFSIGLYEVCEWVIQTYPEDIFIKQPVEIVALREVCKKILSLKREIKGD
jgi:hypothetical protein